MSGSLIESLAAATPSTPRAAWPGRRHVLDLDDFSVAEIGHVLDTATSMKDVLQRPIKQVPALRGACVVTLFYEASTRTRVSFGKPAKRARRSVHSAESGRQLLA